ncbi:MAG: nuclear transport factor 2 family protein [Solirubrobacterales bacterium]
MPVGGEIDDVLPYLDPEVVLRPGVRPPDDPNEEYVGREAYRKFWVSIVTGPWEAVVVEPKEVVEAEDGRVLSVDLWRFLGRDGIEIERELPTLFTFRGGLIARIDGFTDKREALEAAGPSEWLWTKRNTDGSRWVRGRTSASRLETVSLVMAE